MDIILVDTSGLTARAEGDIDPALLSGIGAAIAASVATVQRELEAEGLLPPARDTTAQDGGRLPAIAGMGDDAIPLETREAFDLGDSGIASVSTIEAAEPNTPVEYEQKEFDDEPEDEDAAAPPLYSSQGKEKLYRLLDWLLHQGQEFRIIGCEPEVAPGKRDWFSELLNDVRRRYEVKTLMVLEAKRVKTDMLHRLFELGFRSFIVYDDGTLDEWDAQDCTQAILAFIRDMHTDDEGGRRHLKQSEHVCWGLWLESGKSPDNYRRLRHYQDSGIPWDEIVGPQFSIGSEPPAVDTELLRANEYLPSSLPCRIYNNSLTIDTSGEVLFCPRYAYAEFPPVGNIFAFSPEELFVHKGARTLEVGCTNRCANCNYGGRHFWPDDAVSVVKEFIALGKTEQGAAAYIPAVQPIGEGTTFDLSTADSETQERELAAFEDSLSQWAANMEKWQDDELK